MAKPNYQYEKRQKDLAKQRKRAEKEQEKAQRKAQKVATDTGPGDPQAVSDEPATAEASDLKARS